MQYPTALNGDTLNQLYQVQTSAPTCYTARASYVDGEFIDHHPVFDTLLYGAFMQLGDLLGSQNVGLFVFTVLQSLCGAAVLAASCCYLDRLGAPRQVRIAAVALVALFPIFPLYAATMLKDSTYSIVFAVTFLIYVEVFVTRGAAVRNTRFAVCFALGILLCCLTKKTGSYVLAPSLVVLCIYGRTEWKRLVIAVVAPLVVFFVVVPALVWSALKVVPGGRQESMAFAIQQVTTVLKEPNNDVTDEELAAIDRAFKVEKALRKYEPHNVDGAKSSFRGQATDADVRGFWMAWLGIGLRNPIAYLRSQLTVSAPLLLPTRAMGYYDTPEKDDEYLKRFTEAKNAKGLHFEFYKPEPFKRVAGWVQRVHDKLASLPVCRFLMSNGLYGCLVPLVCALLACIKDARRLIAFLPIFLSLGMVLLSPIASTRYVMSIVFVLPTLLGLASASDV